ncbi:MAG: putative porin [Bacteroidota bacterium]
MKILLSICLISLIPALAFSQTGEQTVTRNSTCMANLRETAVPVDTALSGSQIHNPLYGREASWSELGNAGLPAIRNQYRPLRNSMSPLIAEGYESYGAPDENLVFYRAKSPFTMVNYNSGGAQDKNGQTIRGLFARNLKKDGNITVYGTYINSDGHFNNQKSNMSMINANYRLMRKNYTLITGLARKKFNSGENGGLKDDASLAGSSYPKLLTVNLLKASSNTTDLAWQGVQSIRFGMKNKAPVTDSLALPDSLNPVPPARQPEKYIRIDHQFLIRDFNRKFLDDDPPADFYPFNPGTLNSVEDSVRFTTWTNSIDFVPDTLVIKDKSFSLRGGVRPDFFRYQYADTAQLGMRLGIGGEILYHGQKNTITVRGNWIAAGYAAGDYTASVTFNRAFLAGSDKESQLAMTVSTNKAGADPMVRKYRSTLFTWDNEFLKQNEAAIVIAYSIPFISLDFSLAGFYNEHRIYFNSDAIPAQLADPMVSGAFRVTKRFSAGPFRSSVSLMAQYSSSEIIRLPLLTGHSSTFMHHDIKFAKTQGVLEVEYGFDLRYTTRFTGYSYMPATGIFYLQDESSVGNYPWVDVFAQIKVKRTRLFVEWCHTFSGLMAANSFSVAHYPYMRPHLKYGVYWHFYD